MLTKFKHWLAVKLGKHYAAVVETFDRGLTVFVSAVAAKLVGSGLDLHAVLTLSYAQALAGAGVAAVLTWAQGLLSTGVTGSPALIAPVSRTMRARRENGHRPMHNVDLTRKDHTS